MRVILDSNVFIAAVAARGLCESLVELCLEHHEIILCEGILKEIKEKLTKKLKVPRTIVDQYVAVLCHTATLFKPDHVESDVCRDPNDRMILGLVGVGKAGVIISGDKDLLIIKRYQGVPIVSPRQFWEENKRIPK